MCSGSEAGSYLRLIDFVCHPTLGLRVIKKRREGSGWGLGFTAASRSSWPTPEAGPSLPGAGPSTFEADLSCPSTFEAGLST